jgi:hypothetical protein
VAFYSDKHSVFRINKPEAKGGLGMTQFGRALAELNIEILCANSSQAKGRVERANRTLQDRLVKESCAWPASVTSMPATLSLRASLLASTNASPFRWRSLRTCTGLAFGKIRCHSGLHRWRHQLDHLYTGFFQLEPERLV